ncbi:MAG: ABC transporter ATP-binding protein [Longimicrobiales bacterium]
MRELLRVRPFVRPYSIGYLWGLLLVVVSNGFAIAAPALLGQAIDALDEPGATGRTVVTYALLVVGVALVSGVARFGMRQLLNSCSRRVETDLRDAFFDKLLQLDAAFHGRSRTGDIMSRATNDTQAVRQAIGPGVMYLVNTLVGTVFALVLMLRISPLLTALALIPMLLLPPLTLGFSRVLHRQFERIQDQLGAISTFVQESLAGVRIVRAYVQEEAQSREFDELNRDYLEKNMALARTSGVFHPLLTLLAGLGMVIVLWIGGRDVILGRITIGDFVAFGMYLSMLTWPMIALGWVINLFQRGSASMARLNRIFDSQPELRPVTQPVRLDTIRGEVEFREVSFRYPGTERLVLENVSFRIDAGQTVALVGPTGAGKSTVVALLARLYDPTSGAVLIDGVPADRLRLEQLRGALGVAPQEAFLFSTTIAENIAVGRAGAETDDELDVTISDAANVAQLAETIGGFPHGFETRLGERGITLSGGQRQRTTLARALVRDPRILVLDDALSAVDTQTETAILNGLRRVLERRTSMIISHRVTAVMHADLILVLNEGRIVERGTHSALLAREGLYATLLRRQLLAEGLDEDVRPDALAGAGHER